MRAYLQKEHPQTRGDDPVAHRSRRPPPRSSARFPPGLRNALLIRMLGIKKVADDAARAVESAHRRGPAQQPSTRLARRHRRHPEPARQDAIGGRCSRSLAEVRPDDAKALKGMLFTFDRACQAAARKARTLLLDQVPIERLVLALKGTDAAFQADDPVLARRAFEAHGRGGAAGRRHAPPTRHRGGAPGDRRYRAEDDGQGRDRRCRRPTTVDDLTRRKRERRVAWPTPPTRKAKPKRRPRRSFATPSRRATCPSRARRRRWPPCSAWW